MRLLSYTRNGTASFGAMKDGGVVRLAGRLRAESLRALIAADLLDAAREIVAARAPDHTLDELRFLPPIPDAERILCIGVNYPERNAEYRDSSEQPKYPSVFMRTRESLVGHGEAILRPPESEQLDYEGEIVLVIGREGRRIPAASAHEHIAGLTIMNEGTIRDWVRHGKFNVTPGKNFERSGSMGPWIVTADEIASFDALHLRTRVNGELRQDDTTAQLLFPFRTIVQYLSTFMTLHPGDLISTGTPTGAGARFDPPRWLHAGDRIEVEVEGIGLLSNTVEDESP
jgi:2-keto-4-pentenoate hydratase/2-oxohepta-3-ene-1,7-dioic acid hydratase in catechol pathway